MDYYRPSCSDSCPVEFASVVHDCIKSNPVKRPSAADVCNRLNAALATLFPSPGGPGYYPAGAHPGVTHPPHGNGNAPRLAYGARPPGLSRHGSWASRMLCLPFRTGSGSMPDGVTVKRR